MKGDATVHCPECLASRSYFSSAFEELTLELGKSFVLEAREGADPQGERRTSLTGEIAEEELATGFQESLYFAESSMFLRSFQVMEDEAAHDDVCACAWKGECVGGCFNERDVLFL